MDTQEPLVLASIATITRALKDTAGVSVGFMSSVQRRESLLRLAAVSSQVESLRLRLIAASTDVAGDDGYRDVATWLAHHTRTDRSENARTVRLAEALDRGFPLVADGLAKGIVNLPQAEVIVRGLEKLPPTIDPDILAKVSRRGWRLAIGRQTSMAARPIREVSSRWWSAKSSGQSAPAPREGYGPLAAIVWNHTLCVPLVLCWAIRVLPRKHLRPVHRVGWAHLLTIGQIPQNCH